MANLADFIKKINRKVALTYNSPSLTKSFDSVEEMLSRLNEKDEFGVPRYRTLEEKLGKLLLEFQNSQPFEYFNEQTGILVAIYLMKLSGKITLYDPEDIQFLYRGMTTRALDLNDMTNWCMEHSKTPKGHPQLN